jgi:hypothetical protein
MNIRTQIIIVLLGLGLAASGGAEVISKAYELKLSNFQAPASQNGSVIFKECDDCSPVIVRVTAATRYAINGTEVGLTDFAKAIMQANDRENTFVGVLHHLESNTVKSIAVWI